MLSAIRSLKAAIPGALLVLLALPACHQVSREQMGARAADEWTHTYPLTRGGEIAITNRAGAPFPPASGVLLPGEGRSAANGAIDVEGVEGSTVEIRAERVARATTEKTAGNLLSRIAIVEDVTPDRVSIRTDGIPGILVGVGYDVTYHVKAPSWATVRLQTGAGNITVTGISGRLVASTTSGTITARNIGGGVETRANNGNTDIELTSLGTDPIIIRTTNGSVGLTLPSTAGANLLASCVNGNISLTGLKFEPTGEPGPERGRTRRVRGRFNAGGTSIELQTVNGNISIGAPAQAGTQD